MLHVTFHALGLDDLVDDPRYKDRGTMLQNTDYLYDRMMEAFETKTAEEWSQILGELDISFEVLAGNWEVSKDPQAWANGCLTHMECPNGSTYIVPNTPVEFSGSERTQTRHAGTIGCDTREVLTSLGYTQEQIDRLLQQGVAVGE